MLAKSFCGFVAGGRGMGVTWVTVLKYLYFGWGNAMQFSNQTVEIDAIPQTKWNMHNYCIQATQNTMIAT